MFFPDIFRVCNFQETKKQSLKGQQSTMITNIKGTNATFKNCKNFKS